MTSGFSLAWLAHELGDHHHGLTGGGLGDHLDAGGDGLAEAEDAPEPVLKPAVPVLQRQVEHRASG